MCLVKCNKSSERILRMGRSTRRHLRTSFVSVIYHSQPRIYADDTNKTFASSNVEKINECINSDLEAIPYG